MRSFLRCFRGLHIWLLVNVSVLLLFFILRANRAVMNVLSGSVAMPFERALGWFWSYLPVSMAELCYVAAAIALPVFLVRSIVLIRRAEYKRDAFYRRLLGFVNTLLSIYAAFCLLWGVNYYADGFCDKSGIRPKPVTQEDLVSVTRYFAAQAGLYAPQVQRDENGVYAVPREDSLRLASAFYQKMYGEFPFLNVGEDPAPKTMIFSRVMSAMGFTGFYFPFTGESNLNADFPAATFPATIAHELAHRRGIASEQECNFLAVLAATRIGNDACRYSGWLLGYIHLSNALYKVDQEAWREIRLSLPAEVEADLRAASDYWAQYENNAVSRASEAAYDSLLRSYGEEQGVQSYGAVVDLLVTYFR